MPASRSHSKPAQPKAAQPQGLAARLGGDPRILAPQEHGIEKEQAHPAAVEIVRKLSRRGHVALIVGGAVRDMLLGRTPKDFDIVTSARPQQVKEMFQHARIIGRRFRLVLVRHGGIEAEVSTFRAKPRRRGAGVSPIVRDNLYGNPKEDAFRRDFTINALGFDPETFSVIDYVGGLEDVKNGVIRTLSPPEISFAEDPVRMLRAIRFQVRLGFALDPKLKSTMGRMAGHLREAVRHRLAEETQRFLSGSQAVQVFAEFKAHGLIMPLLALQDHPTYFTPDALADPYPLLRPYLEALDGWVAAESEPVAPTVSLLGMLVTLARPSLVKYLRGDPLPPAEIRAIKAELRREIPEMLGEWGLLKGQVVPALQILACARKLLWESGRGVAPEAARRPGIREAWLLLILLKDVLGLDAELLERGKALIPSLPVLPILDHHTSRNRTANQRGKGPGKHGAPPRKRRRRRRRSGRPAPAGD